MFGFAVNFAPEPLFETYTCDDNSDPASTINLYSAGNIIVTQK